jgi:hypothetical protein
MWRGGLRFSLSVAAPFVWRCLNSRTITPFPHPSHRTGQADLPHPALGQDSMPSHTKGHPQFTRHHTGPCYPGVHRPSTLHITAKATTWAVTGFPDCNPGSSFASACGTFRSACTLPEFTRVSPISCALLLSAPALNQGPFPPPALPGFPGTTGLSATP